MTQDPTIEETSPDSEDSTSEVTEVVEAASPVEPIKRRRGRPPKYPKPEQVEEYGEELSGDSTDSQSQEYSFGKKRLTFKVERHLWESLERWAKVYQLVEGTTSSPPQVARKFLHYTMRKLQAKVKSGEIDPLDVNCRLP